MTLCALTLTTDIYKDAKNWTSRCVDYLSMLAERTESGYIDARNTSSNDGDRPYLLSSLFWKNGMIKKEQFNFGKSLCNYL